MPASTLTLLRIGSVLMLLTAPGCTTSSDEGAQPAGSEASDAGAGRSGSAGRPAAADSGTAGSTGRAAAGRGGAAGERAVDSGVADSGASLDASSADDAGIDDTDAAVSCDGEIVSGPERCLQDDAFCTPLPDGRYCTGPRAPECPKNSTPIAKDAPCPERTDCWDYSESLRCARRLYTLDECAAAGGVALADPGDGSLVCPNDAVALGAIDGAGWDEGGLCCPGATDPTPKQCGARAGDTCTATEFCDYRDGQLCGQADAQATCKARPSSCSGSGSPVCGCDQRTYPSACEANAAGVGIFADAACR
jgi:hypothetical protein